MKTMQIPTLFRFSALAMALALATPAIAHPALQDQRDQNAAQHREDRDARADRAHDARKNPPPAMPAHARDVREAAQARQRDAERQQGARQQAPQEQRDRAVADRAREQARQRQAVEQQRAQAARREAAERRAEAQQHVADQRREHARQHTIEQQRADLQRRSAEERREALQRRAADQREDALRARQRADAQQRARQRVSDAEHRQRIADQQRRLIEYRTLVSRHEALERRQFQALQQARRQQAWRYQQAYWAGVRSMQSRWANRGVRYDNDPYYWAPASYRYVRGGQGYLVNQYAADLLQQAVRYGYDQGVRAGEADRLDRWGGGYNNNFAFQDALYGYNGYYVSPEDYSYYFRQGFQRGYQDGYNRAWQYGRYDNGSYNLLSSVLQMILNLQPLG